MGYCMVYRLLKSALFAFVITGTQAQAQDVRITAEMPAFSVSINGVAIDISRIQDTSNRLDTEYAQTSRPCPPFCVQPVSLAPGVETIGELELLSFLEEYVENGTGFLVDSRTQDWFARGSIPGAVNIPNPAIEPGNPYRDEILLALGATHDGDTWNYDDAKELALFCNGPWCGQSPAAIKYLIIAGYPQEKLHYYRGGVQMWVMLGLSLTSPNS